MARHNIRVLIAEDHHVVREGLRVLIGADPELEIAGEASSGAAAVRLARDLRPDVVLMDLAMPNTNGMEATRTISGQSPRTRVLVLSAYQDDETVREALQNGAVGYVSKHSAASELLTAIREVSRGKRFCSARIANRLRALERSADKQARSGGPPATLTPREREVLLRVAQGQANKQVAGSLGLSIKTVEKHRQAAMDKLNLHDTASLTRYAIAKGLVSPGPIPDEAPTNPPALPGA